MQFYNFIIALKKKGYSIRQIASLVECSPNTVWKWVKGDWAPKEDTIKYAIEKLKQNIHKIDDMKPRGRKKLFIHNEEKIVNSNLKSKLGGKNDKFTEEEIK